MTRLYISEVRLALDEPEALLRERVVGILDIPPEALGELLVRRKSLDTRNRTAVRQVFGVEVDVEASAVSPALRERFGNLPKRALPAPPLPRPRKQPEHPVVIVGAGPAGLFCAQRLVDARIPVILLERGKPIRGRARDCKVFQKGGELNPESNIQFGEGGAGAYSDGKLTYRTDDPLAAYVLETFIRYGANPDIRYLNRPHIGTEHLRACIVRMSEGLESGGAMLQFNSRLDGLVSREHAGVRQLAALQLSSGREIPAEYAVLALGHSARDTFERLHTQGLVVIPKAFAVGVRAEHPQEMIDRSQYGAHAADDRLPRASYALSKTVTVGTDRGVYSFCMCPGGEIMACSSETGGVVTNGMSYSVQRSGFANSGIVVSLTPADYGGSEQDPFAGIRFQRQIEEAAFRLGGRDYRAPAQRISDFLHKRTSGTIGSDATTYRRGVTETDLREVLPPFVVAGLEQALPVFSRRIPGYGSDTGIIVGVESRTSSPIRIPRGDDLQAVGWDGLYPMGEGAGYAGGIVSAAVDGVRAADAIIDRLN